MILSGHIKKIILIGCVIIASSCNHKENNQTDTESIPIAKINSSSLYVSDMDGWFTKTTSRKDSIELVKKFINDWASKEVFYQQALNYLDNEELNIDKELNNFKKELISYKFEKKLIEEKLDTLIQPSEIEEYYNTHTENFLLKSSIVKVLYIKTPISIKNLEKLKALCNSNNPKDAEQLKTLCIQYANNYFMNNDTWLLFDELKKEIIQLKEVPEYLLQKDKKFEFTDSQSYYFLKIIDIKSKNNLSPLNLEKQKIKDLILNQRKLKLISLIKKDFFDKAKSNKELEIYN